MKRTIALAAVSGLLLVTAAACGSDEESSTATEAEAAESAAEDTAAPAATDTGEGATDATEAATEATDAGGSESPVASIDLTDLSLPEGLSGECMAYAQAVAVAFGGLTTGAPVDSDQVAESFDTLEGMVPDDLKDDIQVIAGVWGEFAAMLADFDGDLAKAMADPDVMAAMQQMSTPEVTAASDAISAYFEEVCPDVEGVDM